MKKFLKYAGIFAAVVVVLLGALIVMGHRALSADKEALSRLQGESRNYYEEKGTFVGFCSSELYQETKKNFSYDITCWNDHIDTGVQITAQLVSDYYLCKPATLPPVNGKTLKKFACLQVPGPIYGTIR